MSIDFKDVITFKGKDGGRIAIPRASILSIKTKMEKDYGSSPPTDKEVTFLFVKIEVAELLGIDTARSNRSDIGSFIAIGEKYEIALAILQGNPAAEILF